MNDEDLLKELIEVYYEDKTAMDGYKKSVDKHNKQIKEMMQDYNIEELETDNGLVAKMNIQKRESFNEAKLLEKLKTLGVTTPIKTIEVVDMDLLEDSIYNGQLDASKLSDCEQVKEVITLKVNKKKGE